MSAATRQLRTLGQALWLDSISWTLMHSGLLVQYVDEFDITGLTSNPTLFEQSLATAAYDDRIRALGVSNPSGSALLVALTLEELTRAADLFNALFVASKGADGWVSLEVSPLHARYQVATVEAACQLHERAARANIFIKIPGTIEGLCAVEEVVFGGVPVNVTLLFSCAQYLMAADAYMSGLERRLAAGLALDVASVASMFVSRWDVAITQAQIKLDPSFAQRPTLGIAIAMRTYRAYRELLTSTRWRRLAAAGARPQRLLWASTGSKEPSVGDTWYVQALAATDTIITLPEKTLRAFADHGQVGAAMSADGDNGDAVLEQFRRQGLDDEAMAEQLQRAGVSSFTASWRATVAQLEAKRNALAT